MGWLYSLTSRSPRNPRLSDAGPHGSRSRLHLHTAYCPASVRLTCPSYGQLNFGQQDTPEAQTLNRGIILNSPPLAHLPGD